MNYGLDQRAMLVSLSISQWTATKFDKKVTAETNQAHGAQFDAGRYNKQLVDKLSLKEIAKLASAARVSFYLQTLPWMDDGARILNVTRYDAFTDEMRSYREAWEQAVPRFLRDYDLHVAAARVRLNGMFDERDYPSREKIARKFDFQVRTMPLPVADDFRAQVADEQVVMIRKEIERNTTSAIENAVRDVWERIGTVTERMAEKLASYNPDGETKGDKGIFRDSLVENVRELVGILPDLNITNDPKIASMTRRLTDICQHEAQDLRDDDNLRSAIADKAKAIMSEVSNYI